MPRIADIIFTILFLLYYFYYTALGIAFGGESRQNYLLFIYSTLLGLFLIIASLFTTTKRPFVIRRLTGIILVTALLFFDIRGSLVYESIWKTFKAAVAYLPTE